MWLRLLGWRPIQAVIGGVGCVVAAGVLFAHDDPGPAVGFLALAAWCAAAYRIGNWCHSCLERPGTDDP